VPLGQRHSVREEGGLRWAFQKVIEVAVDRKHLDLAGGGECQFWVEIADGAMLLEKLPPAGALTFMVPTAEMMAANWMI
jgi:hypothetical protein